MARPDDMSMLLAGENDRIEWKRSTGQRDKILQAVCALANDLGNAATSGFVVVGVDQAGTVVGIEDAGDLDQQQKELADRLRSGKIQPVPSSSITLIEHAHHEVLVVQVDPYPVPPIVEVDSVAWVRVGSTTRRANAADLQR